MSTSLRIVLTGPECTGKSVLTTYLAGQLRLPCAMEYARMYLERKGPAYDYPLLLQLSREHRDYQRNCVPPGAPVGLFDTDLINYKIWCEVVYGQCHPDILRAMENDEAHHVYLLCYPDLPWEYDPLRESPDGRLMLFERHEAELIRLARPYHIIRGLGEERRQNALHAARILLAAAR